ncbi:YqgE/AlgH family protein [Bordetella avium]|uniref:YqgE/AlgH family protein n=1 Tax=Bordetella avium TaxID=521 RepID=UPI000E0CBB45|nr:YqgE/AlgH family protein [Bordetella avium]RIQ15475.1 YqgE/AlgH family protein [Bordetella avium]RIQ38413.1 YqgE/AlgH family protein [Bordetella avium]RIQ42954.1 YqgE/AlgH family protein [Bordetella avium]RIQ44115.1 YqgE/AlgH family protein [Bordetella avium]RIQ52971.1 YqgE/AlgH family protein [Bordetella avium]
MTAIFRSASADDARFTDFSNQFLMAMPGMVNDELAGTVIYICEHTPRGALGLVLNRPTDLTLASLFERVDLTVAMGPTADEKVFFGGPVQTDRGFVLHAPAGDYSSSIRLGDLALTTSRDVLQAVAEGQGPARLFVTLGYAGWGAGQLESEMSQNAWLSVAADPVIIFDVPAEERYPAAMRLLGIDPLMLAGEAGHA